MARAGCHVWSDVGAGYMRDGEGRLPCRSAEQVQCTEYGVHTCERRRGQTAMYEPSQSALCRSALAPPARSLRGLGGQRASQQTSGQGEQRADRQAGRRAGGQAGRQRAGR